MICCLPKFILFSILLLVRLVHFSEQTNHNDFSNRHRNSSVLRCLPRRHVVFIGDSVMRYQYISLIYYLEYGEWPVTTKKRCICNENTWHGGWPRYFAVSPGIFHNHESCDCFRPRFGDFVRLVTENRYYRQPDTGVAVDFLYWVKLVGMRGHWHWHGKAVGERNCEPSQCYTTPWPWSGNITTILRSVIRELQPTDIIINHGLWGPLASREYYEIAKTAVEVVKASTTYAGASSSSSSSSGSGSGGGGGGSGSGSGSGSGKW